MAALMHVSLQAQDSDSQRRDDCFTLFKYARNKGKVLVTGTEAGDPQTADGLKDAANKYDYWVFVHSSGEWCGFDKKWGTHVAHDWKGPLIPGTSAHKPRGLAWVTVQRKDNGQKVSVASCHFLTDKSEDRENQSNKPLQDGAVEWAKNKGPNSFVNGDVNTNDKNKNVWGSDALKTSWDELKKWPDTHEGGPSATIDVISRLTGGPWKFTGGKAVPDSELKLNGDHKLIQATAKKV